MKRCCILSVCLLAALSVPVAAAQRPMEIHDLFRFQRVAEPQISPDGKTMVYTITHVDLAGNRTTSDLWTVPAAGGEPRQLTTAGKKDHHPRWSPDSQRILFESNRSGNNQLWVIDLHGGEARKLTSISTEAGNGIWSPDGQSIAFVSAVWPEYSRKPFAESDALNKKRQQEKEKNPVKARVFTHCFFRHWDEWVEDKRQHLFLIPATGGQPRDLTPGDHDAFPTSDTFATDQDITFTPDSKAIVYTAPPEHNEAWSTDYNLYRVSVTGGQPECLTRANKAGDGSPHFSPDGKWLAYRAQRRPGFEADRWEIVLVPAEGHGEPRSITASFDGSPESFVWTPDSESILFTAEQKAASPIYRVSVADSKVEKILEGHTNGGLSLAADGRTLAFTRVSMRWPTEVYACQLSKDGQAEHSRDLSQANKKLLSQVDTGRLESVTVKSTDGTPMQMWIVFPPNFDASKKWPLAYLVHGGPQSSWEDGWSYRWNPVLWAAQGYVVALPNPRGSSGFGQKYTDEISGDWGGQCFRDLMVGVEYMEHRPYIDPQRMAAAGASFGGYMMNWFEGHTNKFKTLISHDGVYNFESMYASTDELWFDEWEHGGPPWVNRRSYEKFSPHRFAKNFKTPMLVIQNDLDFRCPVGEGLQLFTTLQRLGVPSKMLNFPDEGHWVLKPANSAFWHREVFGWLKKYVPPGQSG
ncbi:MAG TPA: S9 family peptidase [Gemmataceae bacterium]|nr:S9 family peptidase [Gemmataceae bacterium]